MGEKSKYSSQHELSHSKYCQWFSGAFKARSNVKEAFILIFFLGNPCFRFVVVFSPSSALNFMLLCCFFSSSGENDRKAKFTLQ